MPFSGYSPVNIEENIQNKYQGRPCIIYILHKRRVCLRLLPFFDRISILYHFNTARSFL